LNRRVFLLILMAMMESNAAVSVTTLMARSTQLHLNAPGTNELVGRYLVVNPDAKAITVYISFGHLCNIQHFTRADVDVPLQKVSIRVNGGAVVELYDRSITGDCSSALTWSTSDLLTSYTVDVLVNWNNAGNLASLAGSYTETIDLVAIETVP